MTDTERIDTLEQLLWSGNVGNGIAIFPCTENKTGRRLIVLMDLGSEDGSHLGGGLTETVPTLREAVDRATSLLPRSAPAPDPTKGSDEGSQEGGQYD